MVSNYAWIPIYVNPQVCFRGRQILFEESTLELGKAIISGCEGEIEYNCIFDVDQKEDLVLYKNKFDEVIGYIDIVGKSDNPDDNGYVIFLPQFKNPYKPIMNLFKEVLPLIKPSLFPDFVKDRWLDSEEYIFPMVKELNEKRTQITNEYNEKLNNLNQEIDNIKLDNKFLTNILISTGTDDFLVDNVKKTLEYIGYKEVIKVDEVIDGKRQEDLKITDGGQFTIIEVKGIKSNPSDDDCHTIIKYMNRNMRKENRTDIQGIFIVNHQRFIPPLKRDDPGFSKEQIEDAKGEGYTLATTWEIFKSVRLLQEGFIHFSDIDKELHLPGLFRAIPSNWEYLGKIEKMFERGRDGNIACFILQASEIKKGDEVFIQEGNTYYRQKIEEMMIENKLIESAKKEDRVSIKIEKKISKQANIFVIKTKS